MWNISLQGCQGCFSLVLLAGYNVSSSNESACVQRLALAIGTALGRLQHVV